MIRQKSKIEQNDFVINLEQNAFSSLAHGIEHFIDKDTPDNLKFAIIHVFHALELFLKARLAKAHPLLIYTKPECEINDDSHTVGFDAIIGRLRNINVKLTNDNFNDINALRKIRNSIEHHKIKTNKEDVKNYIGRSARFLEEFLMDELETNLKDEIKENIYNTLSEAIYSYKERLERAKEEIDNCLPFSHKDRLEYNLEYCPECGEETIIIPDPLAEDELVHCFFCGEKFYYMACRKCGRAILSGRKLEGTEYDPGTCNDCWAEIMRED